MQISSQSYILYHQGIRANDLIKVNKKMDKWLAELEEKYRKTAPFIQTIIPLDDSDAILKKTLLPAL